VTIHSLHINKMTSCRRNRQWKKTLPCSSFEWFSSAAHRPVRSYLNQSIESLIITLYIVNEHFNFGPWDWILKLDGEGENVILLHSDDVWYSRYDLSMWMWVFGPFPVIWLNLVWGFYCLVIVEENLIGLKWNLLELNY